MRQIRSELTNILTFNIHESRNIEFFKNIFLKVLNKHAPIKTKYSRANHSPFVTKELSKAIMLRSKLRNQYLKCKSEEARTRWKLLKQQTTRNHPKPPETIQNHPKPPKTFCNQPQTTWN